MRPNRKIAAILPAILAATTLLFAEPVAALEGVEVRRIDPDRVEISWQGRDSIDIYTSDQPIPKHGSLRLLARHEKRAVQTRAPTDKRVYFVLRDRTDGSFTVTTDRVLPLERGSNARDIGGYAAADGKHVKWGRIYRSAAMPLLSTHDYAFLQTLGIGTVVDLRSNDERELIPVPLASRINAHLVTQDYPMRKIIEGSTPADREYVYRSMAAVIAPQLRAIFHRLLADDGAVLFHCSAGQDRTGVAAGLVLAALGVSRQDILTDYHLSTNLRQSENEKMPLDLEAHADNYLVKFMKTMRAQGRREVEPLYTSTGHSQLERFFESVDKEYGNVYGYLAKELGLTNVDISRLRKIYLQ